MVALQVRDLMTSNVISVRPADTLALVYDVMETRRFRHVPVVDDEGDVLGLISHRDLCRSALGQASALPISNQEELLLTIKVEEVMRHGVETTAPEADLREAGQLILENKFGCLPVVDGDRLVGILTESDFVRHMVGATDTAP